MKYLLEKPIRGTIGTEKFKTQIDWRNGVMISDEPESLGGKDLGPDPYTLLLSSLVACTLATLRMYIAHKALDIPEVKVDANMYYKLDNGQTITHIERNIVFVPQPDPAVQTRLMNIAENCPVSKILKGSVNIVTALNS